MPTLDDLAAALAACPQPEPTKCPPAVIHRLDVFLPTTWQEGERLSVVLTPGWSSDTGRECMVVLGRVIGFEASDAPARVLSDPSCIALPEAPSAAGLLVGLAAVVTFEARRRGKWKSCPR